MSYKDLLKFGFKVIGGITGGLALNFIGPFLHGAVLQGLSKPLDISICETGEFIYFRNDKSFHPVTPFQMIVGSATAVAGGGWYSIVPPLGLLCLPLTVLAVPCACLDYCLLPIYDKFERPIKNDPPKSSPPNSGSTNQCQITMF